MDSNFEKREMEEKKLLQKNPQLMNVLLAKERTIESKLRTTLAVINTATAIGVLGFALIKFFAENYLAAHFGMFLLFCAFVIALYGIKRFLHYRQESNLIKKHRADLAQLIE
jgi:uncharacterized membrane protein YidH (DUF202 family)